MTRWIRSLRKKGQAGDRPCRRELTTALIGCFASRVMRPATARIAMAACTTGERFTTVKDRKKEIRQGLLHAMLNQLGLTIRDIE